MKDFLKKLSVTDIRNVLAIMVVLLSISFVFSLIFKIVPAQNKDLVNILGGNMMGGLMAVIGYYFGASKKDKVE